MRLLGDETVVDIKTIDDITHITLLASPVILLGIGVASAVADRIRKHRKRGDSYLAFDPRLTGGKDVRIYYRPLTYVRPRIKTNYKEPIDWP